MYQLFLRTEKQWYLLLWYWHSLNPKMSIRWQNKIWQTNPSSQSYVFSSGHVPMWDLDHKEGWAPKNCCFPTVMLNKTLKSLLDCKIKAVSPKGNQHWTFIGKTEAEAEAPILWSPDTRSWPIGKDSDAREDWGQENGVTGWDGWIPVGMSLSKLEEIVKDREAWSAAGHGVTKSRTWLSDWTTFTLLRINYLGMPLAIHWLKLHLPMKGVWVQSLEGELRSHRPGSQRTKHKIEAIL